MNDWRHRRHRSGRLLTIPGPKRLGEMRSVLLDLVGVLPGHNAAHGYVKGRSVVTALLPHIGQRYYVHLDLRHFFRSVSRMMVRDGLSGLGLPLTSINQVLDLCFEDEYLPVGAPTSPALSNVACRIMDCHLSLFETYTRYSDQLIFSSLNPFDEGVLRRCVRLYNFQINERKSWLKVRGRQSIQLLGYVVGENQLYRPRRERRRARAERHQEGGDL